mmetsp:Transcript_68162/g.154207  ORF Transcript_68162/g.154207 Transcript_68162/m.154207 type:complete len:593 (-) Transcript_68162:96-1874(-)
MRYFLISWLLCAQLFEPGRAQSTNPGLGGSLINVSGPHDSDDSVRNRCIFDSAISGCNNETSFYIPAPTGSEREMCAIVSLLQTKNYPNLKVSQVKPPDGVKITVTANFVNRGIEQIVHFCATSKAVLGNYHIVLSHPPSGDTVLVACISVLPSSVIARRVRLTNTNSTLALVSDKLLEGAVAYPQNSYSPDLCLVVFASASARSVHAVTDWGELRVPPHPTQDGHKDRSWNLATAYRLNVHVFTPCDLKTVSPRLSFTQLQSLERCADENTLTGAKVGDIRLSSTSLASKSMVAPLPKPWCSSFDGLNFTGGGPGAWTQAGGKVVQGGHVAPGRQLLTTWEPESCVYQPVSRLALATFLGNKRILFWGDSVMGRFKLGLEHVAGVKPNAITLIKFNEDRSFNGLGLGALFESKDSLRLGPQWYSLLGEMRKKDLVLLNSGLHDLAPIYGGGYWYGDKRHVLETYRLRLEVVFRAIANEQDSGGNTMARRVIWRSTTHALIFSRGGGDRWYARCDSQRLSVGNVLRINTIAQDLARTYGIAFWDNSPLTLSASSVHAQDSVHPSGVATDMWSLVFYRHAIAFLNLSGPGLGK